MSTREREGTEERLARVRDVFFFRRPSLVFKSRTIDLVLGKATQKTRSTVFRSLWRPILDSRLSNLERISKNRRKSSHSFDPTRRFTLRDVQVEDRVERERLGRVARVTLWVRT